MRSSSVSARPANSSTRQLCACSNEGASLARTKKTIALVLIVLVLLTILIEFRLALFALGGFLIGAVFFAGLQWKPSLLVPLVLLILIGALFYFPVQVQKLEFHGIRRMNIAYTGTITFVRETSTWSIRDHVTFPDEKKIDQLLRKNRGGDGEVASSVAEMMAKEGWQREEVVGATPNYTKTRTQPAINRRYPLHTTNTFDLPAFRAGDLVSSPLLSASNIQVFAPKYAVSKTYPPYSSRADVLKDKDDSEKLSLPVTTSDDVPTVRVQLASPWLQNEVGFAISKVTLWESLKWIVGVIGAVLGLIFEDEVKKALAPIAKRVLSWFGIKEAPQAAPSPTPTPPGPPPATAPTPAATPTPTPAQAAESPPTAASAQTPTPKPTPSPAPNDQQ